MNVSSILWLCMWIPDGGYIFFFHHRWIIKARFMKLQMVQSSRLGRWYCLDISLSMLFSI
jgi:hypothetical protein